MVMRKTRKNPSWAPVSVTELRESWEELRSQPSMNAHFPSSDDLQTLDRLIAEPFMEDVWQKLIRLGGQDADMVLGEFAFQICRINHRWNAASKETRAALRSEKTETAEMAEKLAKKLTNLKLDTPIGGLLMSAHMEKPYANQPSIADLLDLTNAIMLPSVSDTLHQLSKSLLAKSARVSPITGQPNRSTSERNHFIRELEKHLRQKFGKPMHHQISIVARSLFEDPNIDRDEVKRICRRQFSG